MNKNDINLERVKRNLHLLTSIASCKKCLRNSIIQKGSKDFINSIIECIDNLLRENIPLEESEFKKVAKSKSTLRKLVKKSSLAEKKKLLIQKGGFLQFLLPAAVSVISSLISNATSS
jgi:hypothetical protein